MASPESTEVADEAAAEEEVRDEQRDALVEVFRTELGDAVVGSHVIPGDDVWVRVANDAWREAAEIARHKLSCGYFDFLSAIDWLPSPFGRDLDAEVDTIVHGATEKERPAMAQGYAGGDTRFQVFTRLYSISTHLGVTLKADVADEDPRIATLVPVYAGANWHERETAEMFGIIFVGHPYPHKLYLPGDFEGYPLRKDFPLLARRVKPWPGIVDVEPMPDAGTDGGEEGA